MPSTSEIGITRGAFVRLRRAYCRRWRARLEAADARGARVLPSPSRDARWGESCLHAVDEALRWGEPTVSFATGSRLVWAVPLMRNAQVVGGLVASTDERKVFPDATGQPAMDLRAACVELRRLAEEANLTNAALLESRRREYSREQLRADAIHQSKLMPYLDVRRMYLRDEPALIAAIRKDDRGEARAILNRLLAAMHHQAGRRLDLVKSFFMELTVTMSRTAVEAGGNPTAVLGENYASLSELSTIDSEERLAPWLHEILERIMDAIRSRPGRSPSRIVSAAMEHMSANCCRAISRDDTARAVHVSPSHLSRVVKRQLGRSYTDLLNQMRVDRACEMIARSDRPLAAVALETGFKDQSYFTKVFRKYTGTTPRRYCLRSFSRNRELAGEDEGGENG
jgi:AraC-like DNA-binding protein